jgi:catechol 2,3-dioxygenase-like lactoylglutathione lyase family enzyme
MITGAHTVVFCEDPSRARAFFRDVLGLHSVDAGGGWLIFRLPPAEIAMHPDTTLRPGESRHELFFMCSDLEAAMSALRAKGVELALPVEEAEWGSIVKFKAPGAGTFGLYQPKHPSPQP